MRVLVVLFVTFAVSSAKISSSFFKKCSENDPNLDSCLLKVIQENWSNIVKGDPEYHLVSLTPFHVLELEVNVSTLLSGKLIDGDISGFDEIKFKRVSLDLPAKKLEVWYYQPYLNLLGPYEVTGKLAGVPLEGKGVTNETLSGLANHFEFTFDFKEINGQKHIELLNTKLEFLTCENIYFNFGNLFNGNKKLSDEVHNLLNANTETVFEFLRKDSAFAIGQLYKTALQMMFDKVPYHYFFK